MSRHRQNMQVARRPQGLELRGELRGLSDYRNARFGSNGFGEGFGMGSRGRLEDRGRSIGRIGRRLGALDLGGRRGEGLVGFSSMGGGFMGNPGMYERPFGYGLPPAMRKCVHFEQAQGISGNHTTLGILHFSLLNQPTSKCKKADLCLSRLGARTCRRWRPYGSPTRSISCEKEI